MAFYQGIHAVPYIPLPTQGYLRKIDDFGIKEFQYFFVTTKHPSILCMLVSAMLRGSILDLLSTLI
jgi:hypothetical protein